LNTLLVRDGIVLNLKCVYRLYREEGLAVGVASASEWPWRGSQCPHRAS